MAESAREKRIQNELRVVARIIETQRVRLERGADRLSGRHLRHPENCYTNR